MMTVRVGVIGTGNIGQDHIRRLTRAVAGAQVVAVSDVDAARAEAVAQATPGARVFGTGEDLIRADEVDGVVVASWGPTHYTGGMPITDTAIHEIDILRWLLDQEIIAARVLQPRRTSRAKPGLPDPLIVLMEMAGGAMVDVEVFVNLPYGYDIRCEVVCESGTVALGDGSPVVLRKDYLRSDSVPRDFQERFRPAYATELQEWVDSVGMGAATGPSSWDGYAATAVADSCLAALETGERVPVQLRERSAFF